MAGEYNTDWNSVPIYNKQKDYEIVCNFSDTLYSS